MVAAAAAAAENRVNANVLSQINLKSRATV